MVMVVVVVVVVVMVMVMVVISVIMVIVAMKVVIFDRRVLFVDEIGNVPLGWVSRWREMVGCLDMSVECVNTRVDK